MVLYVGERSNGYWVEEVANEYGYDMQYLDSNMHITKQRENIVRSKADIIVYELIQYEDDGEVVAMVVKELEDMIGATSIGYCGYEFMPSSTIVKALKGRGINMFVFTDNPSEKKVELRKIFGKIKETGAAKQKKFHEIQAPEARTKEEQPKQKADNKQAEETSQYRNQNVRNTVNQENQDEQKSVSDSGKSRPEFKFENEKTYSENMQSAETDNNKNARTEQNIRNEHTPMEPSEGQNKNPDKKREEKRKDNAPVKQNTSVPDDDFNFDILAAVSRKRQRSNNRQNRQNNVNQQNENVREDAVSTANNKVPKEHNTNRQESTSRNQNGRGKEHVKETEKQNREKDTGKNQRQDNEETKRQRDRYSTSEDSTKNDAENKNKHVSVKEETVDSKRIENNKEPYRTENDEVQKAAELNNTTSTMSNTENTTPTQERKDETPKNMKVNDNAVSVEMLKSSQDELMKSMTALYSEGFDKMNDMMKALTFVVGDMKKELETTKKDLENAKEEEKRRTAEIEEEYKRAAEENQRRNDFEFEQAQRRNSMLDSRYEEEPRMSPVNEYSDTDEGFEEISETEFMQGVSEMDIQEDGYFEDPALKEIEEPYADNSRTDSSETMEPRNEFGNEMRFDNKNSSDTYFEDPALKTVDENVSNAEKNADNTYFEDPALKDIEPMPDPDNGSMYFEDPSLKEDIGDIDVKQSFEDVNNIPGVYRNNKALEEAAKDQIQEEHDKKLEKKTNSINQHAEKICIGFTGSEHRIGTTTQALQMVKYLCMNGKKACYIELNANKFVEKLPKWYECTEEKYYGKVSFSGVDMFYNQERIDEVMELDYDIFVFDYGVYNDKNFSRPSFLEKDLQIFVVGSSVSELDNTYAVLSSSFYKNCEYLFNLTPESEQKDILTMMKEKKDNTHFSGFAPDMFSLSDIAAYDEFMKLQSNKDFGISQKRKKKLFGSKKKK